MSSDLQAMASSVNDEASFINFLYQLGLDRANEVAKEEASPSSPWGPGANGWENGSIEAFLDGAAAWGNRTRRGLPGWGDVPGYQVPENPWQRCAEILFMGKHYE